MTANEMKFSWLLKFEAMFNYSAPAYDDRQVSYLLTNAQLRVFKRYYNPYGNKYQAGFEANEQRRRDLEQFIKNASISGGNITLSSAQTGIHPNGKFYDMPEDFLFPIEESAKLTGGTKEIDVKPVRHDQYRANINNPYKNPYSNLVWRLDYSRADHGEDGGNAYTGRTKKRIELITDGTDITDYRIRYIISPPNIVVDEITLANQRHCILDATLHDDIVDEAVIIAKAAINPQEYQVSLNEGQRSE
jgi:hypothetical protein